MLEATLTVSPSAAGLDLVLAVENRGDDEQTLSFRDARRADFVALRDDEEIWRWSEGRMFAQMLGSEQLAPGESVTYEATWENPPEGEYTVRGELAATDRQASAETVVVL